MCTSFEQETGRASPTPAVDHRASGQGPCERAIDHCLATVVQLLGASGAALLFADGRPLLRQGDLVGVSATLLRSAACVIVPTARSCRQPVLDAGAVGPSVGPQAFRLRTVVLGLEGGQVLGWLIVNCTGADDGRLASRLAAAGSAVLQSIAQRDQARALQCQLAELRRARDDAKAGDRAKAILVSKIGHELKTPLNAITGMAQVLHMSLDAAGRDDPALRGLLAHITDAGHYMADVIDTMLKLGQLSMGRVASGDSLDVHVALNDALRIVEQEARRRGVSIVVDGVGPVMAQADRCGLRQVLVNLLSNAIKYNVDAGQVWVSIQNGPRAQIVIRDSGPGLSDAQCARLFHPFERLGADRSTVAGSGLGLLICKELLEAMGGSIAVERPRDGGCLFRISLRPRLAAAA